MNNYKTIYIFGYWSGLAAFTFTVAFCIAQVSQLMGALVYPWDEILIYGFSLCMVVPFLLAMLALYHTTTKEKKFFSHAALIFSVLYAVFVTPNYVVQLATVIPMTLAGEASQVSLLAQTPHSLFWDFDAVGYAFMGLALLAAIPVFKNDKSFATRHAFMAHGFITPLIVCVYFYPTYSNTLLLLASPWIITAPLSMFLLAMRFRRQTNQSFHPHSLGEPFYQYKTSQHLAIDKN